MFTFSAEEAVRRGLAGYERGDDVCVIGAMNRVLAFLARFTPSRLGLRLMAKIFAARAISRSSQAPGTKSPDRRSSSGDA